MNDKNELQIILDTFSAQSTTFTKAVNDMTQVMVQNGKESQELKLTMCGKLDDLKDEMRSVGDKFQNFTNGLIKENEQFKSELKSIITNEVGKVKSSGKWLTMFVMLIGLVGSLFVCLRNVLISNELLNKIYAVVVQMGSKILP